MAAIIGRRARYTAQNLAATSLEERNIALCKIRDSLKARAQDIVSANAIDLDAAKSASLDEAIVKRLVLDSRKLNDLIQGLNDVIELPDPLGTVTLARELSPGLELRRVACPIGVLCVIFESRPEAVVQIASLAIKSGNAVILKGGKEAYHSNRILVDVIRSALGSEEQGSGSGSSNNIPVVPVDSVQVISSRDEVAALLQLDTYIDLVIPRGSNKLVKDIKATTRIPVLGHADGICAVYIDEHADIKKAIPVVVDSKTQYPAACNAAETLLMHKSSLTKLLPGVGIALLRAGVKLHADTMCLSILRSAIAEMETSSIALATGAGEANTTQKDDTSKLQQQIIDAVESDYTAEWLGLDMTVVSVDTVQEAVKWINAHGSHHTDAIVTEDIANAKYFQDNVDSASVYHNASTRFADGFRYGFGAEVGISTNRVHARGPVGLEGLVTYKYKLTGTGQCVSQFVSSSSSSSSSPSSLSSTVNIGGMDMETLKYTHKTLPLG